MNYFFRKNNLKKGTMYEGYKGVPSSVVNLIAL